MANNREQSEARNSSGHPHQIYRFHTKVVRHPREEEYGEHPIQYAKESHDCPDHRRIETKTAKFNGRREEQWLEGTERHVDESKDRVVRGGDEYVSREEPTEGYRCFGFISSLDESWGKKRVLLRRDSPFASTKKLPD